jgi:hypothetical protein
LRFSNAKEPHPEEEQMERSERIATANDILNRI